MDEQTAPRVGERIRELREGRGYSLRELAELSGLSINAISRIERGENSPTVASLHQLANALAVPIADFFTVAASQVSVYVKRDRRPATDAHGVRMESLGSGLPDQRMEPFMLTLAPGTESTLEPVTHTGEEFILVLEGELEYQVGDQMYWLEQGDSLIFQALQPHRCRNNSNRPVTIVLVTESAGGAARAWEYHTESPASAGG